MNLSDLYNQEQYTDIINQFPHINFAQRINIQTKIPAINCAISMVI